MGLQRVRHDWATELNWADVLVWIANLKLPPHLSPPSPAISNHKSVLYVCESVSAFVDKFIYVII